MVKKMTYKELLDTEIKHTIHFSGSTGCEDEKSAIEYIKRNKGNMFELAQVNALCFLEDDDTDYSSCDFENMYKLSISYNENAPERTRVYRGLITLGFYKDEFSALASISTKLRNNELLKVPRHKHNNIFSCYEYTYAILDYDEISKKGKFGDPNTIFGEFKIEKVTMY